MNASVASSYGVDRPLAICDVEWRRENLTIVRFRMRGQFLLGGKRLGAARLFAAVGFSSRWGVNLGYVFSELVVFQESSPTFSLSALLVLVSNRDGSQSM